MSNEAAKRKALSKYLGVSESKIHNDTFPYIFYVDGMNGLFRVFTEAEVRNELVSYVEVNYDAMVDASEFDSYYGISLYDYIDIDALVDGIIKNGREDAYSVIADDGEVRRVGEFYAFFQYM